MSDLTKVEEYLAELKKLGYYSFQIDEILYESVGTNQLNNLNAHDRDMLVKQLEDYIKFARKCKSGM